MPDVGVRLFNGTRLVSETKTDAEGKFAFLVVPPGKYTITYDVVAGSTIVLHYAVDEFTVESGKTTRQDIEHEN